MHITLGGVVFCCCFNPMFFEKNSFAYQTFVGFVFLCVFLSASYFLLSSLRHLVTSTPPPPSRHKSIFFWSNDHRFHDSCFHKTWGWPGGSKVLKEDQGGSKGLCLGIFVGGYDEAYKALLTTTYPLKAYPRHPFNNIQMKGNTTTLSHSLMSKSWMTWNPKPTHHESQLRS